MSKTVCIVVNGEKFQSHAVTLTLFGQCPMSNLSELFPHTAICVHISSEMTYWPRPCQCSCLGERWAFDVIIVVVYQPQLINRNNRVLMSICVSVCAFVSLCTR